MNHEGKFIEVPFYFLYLFFAEFAMPHETLTEAQIMSIYV